MDHYVWDWTTLPADRLLPEVRTSISLDHNGYGDPRVHTQGHFHQFTGSDRPVVLHPGDITPDDARMALDAGEATGWGESAFGFGLAALLPLVVGFANGSLRSVVVTVGVFTAGWLVRNMYRDQRRRRTSAVRARVLDTRKLPVCYRVLLHGLMQEVDRATAKVKQASGPQAADAVRSAMVADLHLAALKMRDGYEVVQAVAAARSHGGDRDLIAAAEDAIQVADTAAGRACTSVHETAVAYLTDAGAALADSRLRELTTRIDNLRSEQVTDLHLATSLWRPPLTA